MQSNRTSKSPQEHAQRIAQLLLEARSACRVGIASVDAPKAQALFETVAEVLKGTVKALNDYSNGTERVWQESGPTTRQSTQSPTVSDMAVDVDASEPPPPITNV